MMSVQISAALIAFSGILLGLFWNQFFNWRKNKQEQKAKLNHLLFNLLELYFFFVRNNFSEVIKIYMAKMEEKLGKIPPEEKPKIEALIMNGIKEKISDVNKHEINQLSQHYELAVKEVAQINPFLAFRLSGQSKKLENLESFNNLIDSLHTMIDTNSDKEILANVKTIFSDERFIKESISDIKDSVLEVSKEISFFKLNEAKKFFVEQESNAADKLDKEISSIVDKMVEFIQQSQNEINR